MDNGAYFVPPQFLARLVLLAYAKDPVGLLEAYQNTCRFYLDEVDNEPTLSA